MLAEPVVAYVNARRARRDEGDEAVRPLIIFREFG
jgi:hypothetical protein